MKYTYPLIRGIRNKFVPLVLMSLFMGSSLFVLAKPKTPPKRHKKIAATFIVTSLDDAGPGTLRERQ